ncbi:M23 family metallopeptidase [Corynebacterium sp. UBA2622]|uniref:M23 family metallopeptidase n=1 Tax=Corynebacterium sp. UBA2622 TaxID=1946393 RepID=UPI0025C0A7D7|nr:M23 family metallopeptidase [Corynebacterium sp. UBA2622]
MKHPLLTAAVAAAVTLAAAAVPASALTVNVGGAPVTSEQDIVAALTKAAAQITTTGLTVNAGDYKVVYDPRSLEKELGVPPTAEPGTIVTMQKGRTSDGRTVVMPAAGHVSSSFGERWGRVHEGIDIANDAGTPIYAVMDGTVINAGPAQGFGNWVVIKHDGGEVSVYGHMRHYDVAVGQRVTAGQQIASIGSEGQSTGPHLHFEIKPDGVNHADPQSWLRQQGLVL